MAGELVSANDEIERFLEKLYDRNLHLAIRENDVRIDFLLAYPDYDDHGNPKGPAIKHQGYAARGLCRILGYKDRVKGNGDAEITLDGEWWEDANVTEAQRLALLDHELTHLVIDATERDLAGRPKLLMRKHDYQVGWFFDVAARWGSAAAEVEQAQILKAPEYEQLLFSFPASDFVKPKSKTPHPFAGDNVIQMPVTKSRKKGRRRGA